MLQIQPAMLLKGASMVQCTCLVLSTLLWMGGRPITPQWCDGHAS